MNIVEKIRYKIGYNILVNKIKNLNRSKTFNNFDTAKSVGVIFDASRQESYLTVKDFIFSLRKKNIDVNGLGYVKNLQAVEYFPYHEGITFFSILHNNSWYLKSKNPKIDDFANKKYDILIDLTTEEFLPLKFVVGLNPANLKIGRGKPTDTIFYDFVLDINEGKNINYFVDQLNYYMAVLKKA